MMILSKVFDNLFSDSRITPVRFRNFCRFLLNALTQNNTDGKYDTDISKVKAILDSLSKEVSEVKTGLTEQVNNTTEVNEFMYNFGQYMKDFAGAIAFSVGGKNTAAYREFYPYKIEEYYRATKMTMPDLTVRVAKAAKKYADKLGDKLASDLQAFASGFNEVVNAQETQIAAVGTDRTGRNEVYETSQWQLTSVVLNVAAVNLGKPEVSQKLFPFEKLYPHNGRRPIYLKGELAAGETKELMNRTLTAEVMVSIKNKSVNAGMMVWLALTPDAPAPETGVVIEAGKNIKITADKLGDIKGTFLMVKNMSDINKGSYVIGILGIKKEGDKEEGEVTSLNLKIA